MNGSEVFLKRRAIQPLRTRLNDKEKLKKQVKALNCAQKENQVAPENAYVAYGDSQFEIVPETEGSKLDLKNAYNVLSEAVREIKLRLISTVSRTCM